MSETPHGFGHQNDPDPDPDDDYDDYDDGVDHPPRRRRLPGGGRLAVVGTVAVLAVAGLALALTSGGGDDAGGSGGGSPGEPASRQDAALEYAACMRENGVEDFPDPESGGGFRFGGEGGIPTEDLPPLEQAAFEEARDTCQPILGDEGEEGGEPLGSEAVAERQDAALAMARCMRDRGWDMPDPQVGEDGSINIRGGAVMMEEGDPDFDRFAEDREACNEEAGLDLPTPGGGS